MEQFVKTILWILLSLLLFSYPSLAAWSLTTGAGAYMGEQYIGTAYASENLKHLTELTDGKTDGVYAADVEQINLQYSYSPFSYQIVKMQTNILGIGFILSHWNGSTGFIESPEQYPEKNYYPMTRYRASLLFTHSWTYQNWSVFVNWALLDQTAIALYNNPEYTNKKEIWSSGFGLRWAW